MYDDPRWKAIKIELFASHPVCAICEEVVATDADHREPHRGNEALFFRKDNVQPLCRQCHRSKTEREKRERELARRGIYGG
jgi:5-methylcytosine-specific restriction protein A